MYATYFTMELYIESFSPRETPFYKLSENVVSPFHPLEELSRSDMSHVVTNQYGNPILFC